ncbi:hypothetical protein EV646_1078 [Kribbella antiqua]|uniref:Uncharacterized protein n=1 Tax=Kribbella antiqua TaxID=2512217 RepID=A0A4R2IPP5_9ACTN|nr:hypothetical protein EV646_1078 [Kribbella antiqua]
MVEPAVPRVPQTVERRRAALTVVRMVEPAASVPRGLQMVERRRAALTVVRTVGPAASALKVPRTAVLRRALPMVALTVEPVGMGRAVRVLPMAAPRRAVLTVVRMVGLVRVLRTAARRLVSATVAPTEVPMAALEAVPKDLLTVALTRA